MAQVSWPLDEYENGVLVKHTDRTITVDDSVVNADLIRQKALAALATNATFLALANPTAAQNGAQAKALTRQVNGIIRILLGALSDMSDT